MAYAAELCGRKHLSKMTSSLNESVAVGPSSFAKNQLKLMGWKEGEGLGKNRQGMADHIRVTKRKDEEGLGHEKQLASVASDQWWSASAGATLLKLQQAKNDRKKKKSKKKDKAEKKNGKEDKLPKAAKTFTDDELFAATGGARFGTKGKGRRSEVKWARAENDESMKAMEKEAKKQMEWNGLGRAKLVLSSNTASEEATTSARSSTNADSDDVQTSASPIATEDEVADSGKSKKKRDKTKKKRKRDSHDTDRDAPTDDATKKEKKEKKKRRKSESI
jgi:Pin2-interacting protein X1